MPRLLTVVYVPLPCAVGHDFPSFDAGAGMPWFKVLQSDRFMRVGENFYRPLDSISIAVYHIPDRMMETEE